MFEDYFRTSEEAGSLYRVEDLLGVVRTGESVEDLRRFLNRWDATIAGMETPPDDLVLRDTLLRQIRKCQLMKYDVTLKHSTELPKSQSKSHMPSYSETFETCWTEKDSDPIEIGLWRKTSRLKSPSRLHPLRGARIVQRRPWSTTWP